MVDYNIYSIRSYNNDKLVFYNYTKRKRIGDILSGIKTRYKRHLNNKDNWINVFYILKEDNSYIKIEEHIVNSNDEIVKSRLCEIIANHKCINKMRNEDIEKLCNKTEEPKTDITENEIQNKIEEVIIEPKTEVIEEVKTPTIIEESKTEVIKEYFNTEHTNTETKIVKYIKKDTADISNNQVELLNDTTTEINEPTKIVNEPNITPTTNVKVVKNLADVKCIDAYEPSITSSSRYSRPSFKQQIEQLKPKYNKTIKFDFNDVVKIMNNKKTLKKHKKDIWE